MRVDPAAIRVRAYEVLIRAIEDGIDYGWQRAHKHSDAPDVYAIKSALFDAIANEVSEWFDFGDRADT